MTEPTLPTPAACEVCIHHARDLIDQMIVNGQPDELILSVYRVPAASLQTHRWEHVSLSMASALADPRGLLVKAQLAYQKIQFWERLCEEAGVKKAAAGLRAAELRLKHIETISRLMEEEASHRIVHDWERIKRVLILVFQKFPEARIEFEHQMREAGENVTVVDKGT